MEKDEAFKKELYEMIERLLMLIVREKKLGCINSLKKGGEEEEWRQGSNCRQL